MARIRSIHPGLFTDEAFMTASPAARVLLLGLWCESDDNGVFEWKPIVLRARILPADTVDGAALLNELHSLGVIKRFEHEGKPFGAVKNFVRFQRPKSPKAVWPITNDIANFVCLNSREEDPETALRRRLAEAQDHKCAYCATSITYYSKKTNSLDIDHDIPRSRGGSDDESNLVAACRNCNRSKGTKTGAEFRRFLAERITRANSCDNNAKSEFALQMEDEGGEGEEEHEQTIEAQPSAAPSAVSRKEKSAPKPTPVSELMAVLSADMARAVVEHRQRNRKALTASAAALLAKQFAKVADPNAAAALMLERGWQGFMPEWASHLAKAPEATAPAIEVAPQFETEEEFQEWWNKRRSAQ